MGPCIQYIFIRLGYNLVYVVSHTYKIGKTIFLPEVSFHNITKTNPASLCLGCLREKNDDGSQKKKSSFVVESKLKHTINDTVTIPVLLWNPPF